MNKREYIPKPIDTSDIELPPELKELGFKISSGYSFLDANKEQFFGDVFKQKYILVVGSEVIMQNTK